MPRPKGVPNKSTQEVRKWARGLLADPEYRTNLLERLRKGTAGPIEIELMRHAYGKPEDKIQFGGGGDALQVQIINRILPKPDPVE